MHKASLWEWPSISYLAYDINTRGLIAVSVLAMSDDDMC